MYMNNIIACNDIVAKFGSQIVIMEEKETRKNRIKKKLFRVVAGGPKSVKGGGSASARLRKMWSHNNNNLVYL